MTKLYELPNERRFIADVDKDTRICNVTEPQLDILISDLNGYAERCEHAISLDKVKQAREQIIDEKDFAYADFERYKEEVLNVESDELPDDDFRYGMERCLEILDKLIAESEE